MTESESSGDLWWLGAIIYVFGSVLINLGSNMIRRGHETVKDMVPKPKFYENHWWFGGFVLFAIGNVFNFVAFMFAAQSLLVSLGSIQFIANFVFARYINKEKVKRESIISVSIIIAGIILVVVFGSKTSRIFDVPELFALLKQPAFLIWLILEMVLVIILQSASLFVLWYLEPQLTMKGAQLHPRISSTFLPLSFSIVSVCIGTQSILLGKMLSGIVLLTIEVPHSTALLTIWPYVIGLLWLMTSAFYIHRLNDALRLYDALFIIPTLQGLWLFFGALEGGIYFQELQEMTWWNVSVFCIGLLLIVAGVMVLATKKKESTGDIQFLEAVTNVETDVQFYDMVTNDRVFIYIPSDDPDDSDSNLHSIEKL